VHIGLSLLIVTLSVGVSQTPARNFRWWLDADVQRELALTGAQVAALQVEYDRTLERRRRLRRALDMASAELTHALDRGDLSDDAAEALVGRVEEIRRRRNTARMRLLVAMYFLLTRDQRARLPAILERRNVAEPAPCQ
jgi:Spy/CpxP family protein refolding chaperone